MQNYSGVRLKEPTSVLKMDLGSAIYSCVQELTDREGSVRGQAKGAQYDWVCRGEA